MNTWTKRDPIKNYFPLPNEIYHLGLSTGAIAVNTSKFCTSPVRLDASWGKGFPSV